MTTATLTIELDAIAANWRALDGLAEASVETAAVVKADGYGLGSQQVSKALAQAGTKTFFVADTTEGIAVRNAVGASAEICVFAGHMAGDTDDLARHSLIPMLNSDEQFYRHQDQMPNRPFGVQLDSGMNRLGMEAGEFSRLQDRILIAGPQLVMSHMACTDVPDHPQNLAQLRAFHQMTDGLGLRRSLAATGGILLGPQYHFDLIRPGIGLYGGLPFETAKPVVGISIPVIQIRDVAVGETVGYAASWCAQRPSRIATIAAGYADGLIRAMGGLAQVWAGEIAVPVIGRVSMDMLTIDVTDLPEPPQAFDILGPHQNIDDLAVAAGSIGHEILTSLGARYKRVYKGG